MTLAFLRLTDPDDGTPTFVRIDRIEAVYYKPDAAHTVVHTAGGSYDATESVEDVMDRIGMAAAAIATDEP